jgi:hypothetical protein
MWHGVGVAVCRACVGPQLAAVYGGDTHSDTAAQARCAGHAASAHTPCGTCAQQSWAPARPLPRRHRCCGRCPPRPCWRAPACQTTTCRRRAVHVQRACEDGAVCGARAQWLLRTGRPLRVCGCTARSAGTRAHTSVPCLLHSPPAHAVLPLHVVLKPCPAGALLVCGRRARRTPGASTHCQPRMQCTTQL